MSSMLIQHEMKRSKSVSEKKKSTVTRAEGIERGGVRNVRNDAISDAKMDASLHPGTKRKWYMSA